MFFFFAEQLLQQTAKPQSLQSQAPHKVTLSSSLQNEK